MMQRIGFEDVVVSVRLVVDFQDMPGMGLEDSWVRGLEKVKVMRHPRINKLFVENSAYPKKGISPYLLCVKE
jgi:hypothetical protein